MIARLSMVALLLAVSPCHAQDGQGNWIADPKTGCVVWDPSPEPGETVSWSGPCVNGKAQGKGVLQWYVNGKPHDRVEGEYRGGIKNGYAVIAFVSGSRFQGTFKDGKAHGEGTRTEKDGQVYSGTWTNGCFKQGNRWAVMGTSPEECGFK
jgi:hypothetical protein